MCKDPIRLDAFSKQILGVANNYNFDLLTCQDFFKWPVDPREAFLDNKSSEAN